jgi:hypothetical protein
LLVHPPLEFLEQGRRERRLVEHEPGRKRVEKSPGIGGRARAGRDVVEIDHPMGFEPLENRRLADLPGALEHLDRKRPRGNLSPVKIPRNPHRTPLSTDLVCQTRMVKVVVLRLFFARFRCLILLRRSGRPARGGLRCADVIVAVPSVRDACLSPEVRDGREMPDFSARHFGLR